MISDILQTSDEACTRNGPSPSLIVQMEYKGGRRVVEPTKLFGSLMPVQDLRATPGMHFARMTAGKVSVTGAADQPAGWVAVFPPPGKGIFPPLQGRAFISIRIWIGRGGRRESNPHRIAPWSKQPTPGRMTRNLGCSETGPKTGETSKPLKKQSK